jgi:hypothetical protein
MSRKKFSILVPLISLVLLLLSSFTLSCTSAALLAPKITFTDPPGNIYAIGDVTVSVSISNANIVYKPGEPPLTGEGALIYYLDVDAPITQGIPATTNPGTWASTTKTSYIWHNVGSGSHIVSVEMVNNDLTPLNPPVISMMRIEVIPEPGDPKVVILTPRDGVTFTAGDVTISAEVNNLSLVENTGQTPAAGEGHIIYFMDVEAPTDPGKAATTEPGTYSASASTSYTWHNVPAGVHTFSVELVNDDDTPLSPAVTATVAITASK